MLETLSVRGVVDSCVLAAERGLAVSCNSGNRREYSPGDTNGCEYAGCVLFRCGNKSADKSIHVCPFEKTITLDGGYGEVR